MKTNIDYSNDIRWNLCSDVHKKHGISPNWFLSILLESNISYLKDINIAIETGTFEGSTASFFADHFETIHTIEKFFDNNSYSNNNLIEIHKKLKEKHNNINFYYGDSSDFLEKILMNINEPCVILLDAHNGLNTPIKNELISIKKNLKHKKSIIIIDDCDDIGTGDWPNMEELQNLIKDINPLFKINFTGLGRNIIICYE